MRRQLRFLSAMTKSSALVRSAIDGNNPTRSNAEHNYSMNLSRAKNHVEIRSGKCTDPMFDNENVIGFRSQCGMNCTRRALKKILVRFGGLNGAYELVAIAHLGQTGPEPHLNQNHRHSGGSGRVQHIRSSRYEIILSIRIDGNDASLAVQSNDGRITSIEGDFHG